jgi:hypothetical protein
VRSASGEVAAANAATARSTAARSAAVNRRSVSSLTSLLRAVPSIRHRAASIPSSMTARTSSPQPFRRAAPRGSITSRDSL